MTKQFKSIELSDPICELTTICYCHNREIFKNDKGDIFILNKGVDINYYDSYQIYPEEILFYDLEQMTEYFRNLINNVHISKDDKISYVYRHKRVSENLYTLYLKLLDTSSEFNFNEIKRIKGEFNGVNYIILKILCRDIGMNFFMKESVYTKWKLIN